MNTHITKWQLNSPSALGRCLEPQYLMWELGCELILVFRSGYLKSLSHPSHLMRIYTNDPLVVICIGFSIKPFIWSIPAPNPGWFSDLVIKNGSLLELSCPVIGPNLIASSLGPIHSVIKIKFLHWYPLIHKYLLFISEFS